MEVILILLGRSVCDTPNFLIKSNPYSIEVSQDSELNAKLLSYIPKILNLNTSRFQICH